MIWECKIDECIKRIFVFARTYKCVCVTANKEPLASVERVQESEALRYFIVAVVRSFARFGTILRDSQVLEAEAVVYYFVVCFFSSFLSKITVWECMRRINIHHAYAHNTTHRYRMLFHCFVSHNVKCKVNIFISIPPYIFRRKKKQHTKLQQ